MQKEPGQFLYRQVVDLVRESISTGTLGPGDRLPSLRKMSQAAGVSVPTVRQAYIELERQRRVESRPRSGFYVRRLDEAPLVRSRSHGKPGRFRSRPLMERVFDGIDQPNLVPLGIANPSMAKPAAKTLHRRMKRIMGRAESRTMTYSATLGEAKLRRQIALRYLDTTGAQVDPDTICITNGGQEALLVALKAVASHGDIIAVETPTYHGLLELIDSLGMLALEVETCPEEGVVIGALEETLAHYDVKACLFSTTLSNPLGVEMPAHDRARLAELLERTGTPLIEDDVYGELHFDNHRAIPTQFLRSKGQSDTSLPKIITCGSYSKTAAPGYRIGWVAAGPYRSEVARLKRSLSCASGLLPQLTLADFLSSGDYERHLKLLRAALKQNSERMSALVASHFPDGTRTSRPVGGSVLWIELPGNVRDVDLFERAIEAGISISPGRIFSPSGRYSNFIRLSFGHPWSTEIENAIRWLGTSVHRLADSH